MANRWKVLLQEKADLTREYDGILAAAQAENRPLTQTERGRLDAILPRLQQIEREIIPLEAERAASIAGPSLSDRKVGGTAYGPGYREMFGTALDNAGFRTFAEFATALHGGLFHPGFQALMRGGDATGTGYLIPPEYAAELFDQALEDEIVRPRARIEPMASNSKIIAGLSHGDGTDAPFGVSGSWTPAGEQIVEDDAVVRSMTLTAHKLAALVQVANEAAADGDAIESQLSRALVKGLAWLLDVAFFSGTGAGQPLGVLNAPATITVDPEAAQEAGTINYVNLTKMFARLHPSCLKNAVWVANATAIPQLLTLTIAVGAGGSHIPVLKEGNGQFTLLTRPVIFTEKLPGLGNRGDILLADFSQYAVGLRADIVLEKSQHLGFARDTTYYRCKLRADGQPVWATPYTPKNGDTLSPFVTLGPRLT